MLREIRKKLVILGNRLPFAAETAAYIDHMERTDWIYMNLRLDGSPLTRENIEGMMRGEVVLAGRVTDHVLLDRLDRIFDGIYENASAGVRVSPQLLAAFAGQDSYRKSTPTIMEYSYTPPLPGEISQQVRELCDFANQKEEFEDPFMKAARLHNRLVSIYPFREGNQLAARGLMEYFLVSRGYPMVPAPSDERDYNTAVCHFIRTGDSTPLADYLCRGVHDRLELMIQLTAY